MIDDALQFLSTLSFQKSLNFFKAEAGFLFSRLIRRPVVCGLPYSYSIEPTSSCNLHCTECPTGMGTILRKKGSMSIEQYHLLMNQIADRAVYLMLYLQGEPYLHSRLFEMIRIAHQHKIYTCTSTNGHFLTPPNAEQTVLSGLNRLIISVDGTTQDTYQQYRRGGQLHVVLKGIRELVEAKKRLASKTPVVILQLIVFKHNQHQLDDFRQLGKQLQVDQTQIKTAQVYDVNAHSHLVTDIDRYSRYRKTALGYQLKRKLHNHCRRLYTTAAITHEGGVLSCCYDKDGEYLMGNVFSDPLPIIWKRLVFRTFRQVVISSRKSISICCNCDQ